MSEHVATAHPVELERAPCNLCGSWSATVVYGRCRDLAYWRHGAFDVVRCTSCDLVRTDPRPTTGSAGAYYPSEYHGYAEVAPLSQHRPIGWIKRVLELPYALRYGAPRAVVPPVDGKNALLDIGCGSGDFLVAMATAGWDVWGIEPNPGAAAAAARRPGIGEDRIFAVPAERASPGRTFDLITISHVLEHLHDPLAVLRRARTWLAPNGRLRISVPNFGSFERKLFGRYWLGLDIPRHLFHFTPATLERVLAAAGYQMISVKPQPGSWIISGSIRQAVHAALDLRRPPHDWRILRYALMPVASVASALGHADLLEVTAALAPRRAR